MGAGIRSEPPQTHIAYGFEWLRRSNTKLGWAITALCLAALFLIGNSKLVTGARVPIWDAWAFYGPEFTLVADHARAGHFLLWNPWVNGGTPDNADPTIGAASPLEIVVAAIAGGTRSGFVAYWLLIWLLGPLGLLLLGRHLGAPTWGAFVVAAAYAFSGFYIGHAEHTSFVYSFSFLPLLIWRFDQALATRLLWPAVQTGGLWGLSALGGYPQLTFLSAVFLCLWAFGRCCFRSPDTQLKEVRARSHFGFAIVALILTLSLGAIVLAPSYVSLFSEGSGYTDRVGPLSKEIAVSSNELDPGTLLTFASPYLHLLKYPGFNPNLWPKSDPSVMGNYIGALPLIFGLLAIASRPTSGWRWWLAGIVLLAIACALGDHLPIRAWLYDYCPPTRYFRHSGAFRGYAIFGAAVLALAGAGDLDIARNDNRRRIWKRLALVSILAASAAIFSYYHVLSEAALLVDGPQRGNRQVILVWIGSALLSCVFLIFPRMRKKALPILLCLIAIADGSYTIRISQPLISDSGFFGPLWARTDADHQTDLTLPALQRQLIPPSWLGAALNNGNVPLKIATLYNDATMANRFQMDFAKHPVLAAMSLGSNRIWFADKVAAVVPSDDTYAALVKRTEAIGAPVIIVHPPSDMAKMRPGGATENAKNIGIISDLPAAKQIPAGLVAYTPNQLELKVNCAADGWLLITDRWSRGWYAMVNDIPVQVYGGDLIFRAISVRAGENKVDFYYRPTGWPMLLILSWSTLFIIFAGSYVVPKRRTQD